MSCQIKNRKYFAKNGQESKLYKDLVEKVGENKANDLFIFAYSKISYFKSLDENGEPSVNKVLELATKQNASKKTLTIAEQVDMQIQFPNYQNSTELLADFENAFYDSGQFAPTKKTLTKSLYSAFEAENLLSDLTLLSQVKDSIERLKNTKNVEYTMSVESKYKSSDLNIFGKFKILNPYISEQDLIEKFGGIESDEVEDKSITTDYKRIPVIDENGNAIINKVIYPNAVKLIEDLDNITEEKLFDFGIDASKIKTEVIMDFLQNPSEENTARVNKDAPQREKVIKTDKQDRDLVFLETTKTEEQLFEEQSLIQTEIENVYHKVGKVDEQELRDFLKVGEKVLEHELYKQYYKYNTPSQSNFTPSFSPSLSNLEYLKGDFLADFNAEILKNPSHEFYNKFHVNEKGINLKYSDPISLNQIEAYLEDGVKLGEELKQYSTISKNIPNFNKQIQTQPNSRLEAVNNISSLKTLSTFVTAIDKNTIFAKNETEQFINYGNEVFELKNKEFDNSVFTKLNITKDVNYFQTEVETQQYVDQVRIKQSKIENFNTLRKHHKESELSDNFNCV